MQAGPPAAVSAAGRPSASAPMWPGTQGPTAKPLTEARDAEQEQGLPTLLPQSSHPRGWEPSPSGPMEDQIHERVHTYGPLISQTRQAQAGLRVMKELPASDSSLLSSGCGR